MINTLQGFGETQGTCCKPTCLLCSGRLVTNSECVVEVREYSLTPHPKQFR